VTKALRRAAKVEADNMAVQTYDGTATLTDTVRQLLTLPASAQKGTIRCSHPSPSMRRAAALLLFGRSSGAITRRGAAEDVAV
jgi:hypothetical protein